MRSILHILFLITILYFSTKGQSKLHDYFPMNENQDSVILQNKRIKEINIDRFAHADIQYL